MKVDVKLKPNALSNAKQEWVRMKIKQFLEDGIICT